MIVDCNRCAVRGDACGDCVVGVLLGMPGSISGRSVGPNLPSGAGAVQLDAPEHRALDVLADQGLVPRLRLVSIEPRQASPDPVDQGGFSDVG